MISAAIERCAGIDVGKKFLVVCVMVGPLQGEPQVEIRKFGTIRSELEALRHWLKQQAARGHPCGNGKHRLLLEARV